MSFTCPRNRAEAPGRMRPDWEVADVFRRYGNVYRATHALPGSHHKIMRAIESCRTAALGGHLDRCDACGFERPAYNSCGNRHCPKCQALTQAKWLQARKAELLPVGYFHNVFTLPHELNTLAGRNTRVTYDLLFRAVAETLLDFGRRRLGGEIGFTAILHTWDQKLLRHLHVHCLIPGGALSPDGQHWLPAGDRFLFPVRALSRVFRRKFIQGLCRAFGQGRLQLPPTAVPLGEPDAFRQLLQSLRSKDWVVYSKPPFTSPEQVLEYFGRYTHRVAISNRRILDVSHGRVKFTYRDRRRGDTVQCLDLDAQEFIRRFLLHALPKGFKRIRHFGLLANRCKRDRLSQCRRVMDVACPVAQPEGKSLRQWMLELTGQDVTRCPQCGRGTLRQVAHLPRSWGMCRGPCSGPVVDDTS